jgi:hypothetical protein
MKAALIDTAKPSHYTAEEPASGLMPSSGRTNLKLQIGDIVALNEMFVDRHSGYANSMPFARGKVTAMHHLDKVILADIEWDRPGLPKRINVKNLTTEKGIASGE